MATYFTNFENDTLTEIPSYLISRWNTSLSRVVTAGAEPFSGSLDAAFGTNVFRLTGDDSTNFVRMGYEFDGIAGSTNDNITGLLAQDTEADQRTGIIFRGSGGPGTETGYYLQISKTDGTYGQLRLLVYDNGTTVNSVFLYNMPEALPTHRMLFDFQCYESGDDVILDLYIWELGTAKPATPSATHTPVLVLPVGWMGLGWVGSQSVRSVLGWVGFGSSGDAAPTRTGIRITGIKEPNIADQLVTGVTTATVHAWLDGDDEDGMPTVFTGATIDGGEMELALPGSLAGDYPVITARWAGVGDEIKYFRFIPTVINLDT